jgi:hypothetical protein
MSAASAKMPMSAQRPILARAGRTYVRMPWTIAEDAEAVGLMCDCDRRVALTRA